MYALPIYGEIGKDINLGDVLLHLKNAQTHEAIKLLIASPGGSVEVGEKIKEAIKSTGKPIYSVNTGDVCSMAVDLFLIAPKENREFYPSRGQFLIHNPWTEIQGEANDLIQVGKELKKLEADAAKRYSEATGTEVGIIAQFMAENIPLTPEQVEQLGFATVKQTELQAVAKFNINQKKGMEKVEKSLGVIEKMMLRIAGKLNAKSLLIQDVNGAEIDFGAEITDPSEIVIGVMATVSGAPATGEYVLPDGRTLVFAEGALTEIKEAEAENPKIQELKNKIEALELENQTLKASANKLAEITNDYNQLDVEFKKFKSQFVPDKPVIKETPKEVEVKKVFSFKRK